jgi:DNA-binding transcriptional MerR regulator
MEKSYEEFVSIGELAKSLGVTTRTLRYYEELGLIETMQRADGATRGYTPYYVRRIKFILKLKELGLSLREVQNLSVFFYGEAQQTEKMIPRLIDIFDIHINKIDEKMARLAYLRKEIVEYRQRMANKFNLDKK